MDVGEVYLSPNAFLDPSAKTLSIKVTYQYNPLSAAPASNPEGIFTLVVESRCVRRVGDDPRMVRTNDKVFSCNGNCRKCGAFCEFSPGLARFPFLAS